MKSRLKVEEGDLTADYCEESIKVPLAITVAAVLLVGCPLGYWVYTINEEGFRATDVSKYNELVQSVEGNVQTVNTLLHCNADELAVINAARKASVVTLIIPEEDEPEEGKAVGAAAESAPFRVSIDGIYWNPANPLVGINGETYREGDRLNGHTIVKIGKTTVRLRDAIGNEIEMDMYENLLK